MYQKWLRIAEIQHLIAWFCFFFDACMHTQPVNTSSVLIIVLGVHYLKNNNDMSIILPAHLLLLALRSTCMPYATHPVSE